MKNILTIMRRELSTYFTSPIGYIYIITFLLVTNILGLMIANAFFIYPVADMRTYFHAMAGVSTIFMAAISMRLWAEERKENTFEMLLTFPMKASELVLGKFFASFVFYAIAVAGTLTVPVMMAVVSRGGEGAIAATGMSGLLDLGPVVSGYFGTLLLGAMMLAIGMFVSSLCRDQIVAFVITAPVLFGAYIAGLPFVRMALDSALAPLQSLFDFFMSVVDYPGAGVGAFIADFIGIFVHFDNLTRGLVGLDDVLFFVVWAAALAFACAYWIAQRGQSGNVEKIATLVVTFLIAMAANLFFMASPTGVQADLTQDKLYTVSDISGEILKDIDDVTVKYYVSRRDKMPPELQSLERDVTDKLETIRKASGGKLTVKIIGNLEAAKALADPFEDEAAGKEKDKDKDSVERRLLKKVQPFQVQVPRDDQITTQLIYSAIEITYKDKESEVVPQIVPQMLPKLEYLLVNKAYRLTRKDKPVVALVAPESALNIPANLANLYRQMGQPVPESEDHYEMVQKLLEYENYEVRRVKLTQDSPLPDAYDVLVVLEPKGFNERQQWELSRALASGKPAVLAVQEYEYDYRIQGRGLSVNRRDLNSGIGAVLQPTGVTVDNRVLMDVDAIPLSMGGGGIYGQSQPYTLPMHIMVKSAGMNQDSALTRSLSDIFYLWGTGLNVDKDALAKSGLAMTTLFQSGARSWAKLTAPQLVGSDIQKPTDMKEMKAFPLCVMLEGQIPYAFADKERPEWPAPQQDNPMQPPAEPKPETTPDPGNPELKPGKLILLGCATMFRKDFFQGDSVMFLKNCVDSLALGEIGMKINALGNKTAKVRTIAKLSETQTTFWKAVHVLLVYLAVAVVGVAVFVRRVRRREAYAESVRR